MQSSQLPDVKDASDNKLEDKINHLINEGDKCLISGDQLIAQKNYLQVLSVLSDKNQNDSLIAADIQRKMGDSFRDLGNQTKAKEYYTRTLEILKTYESENLKVSFDILIIQGNISYISNDLKAAEILYRKALKMLDTLPELNAEKTRTLRKLGDVYRSLGNYNEAEKQYLDDLAISKDELEMASTMRKLGNIYQAKNEFAKAIDFYEKALVIKRKHSVDNKMTLVNILNCLGNLYCYLNEPDQAIAVLHEARDIITDKKHLADADNRYLIYTLKWLARAEILKGNSANAKDLLEEVQEKEGVLYSRKENIEKGWTFYHLSLYYKLTKDYVKAEELLQKALIIFQKQYSHDNTYIKEINEQLQELTTKLLLRSDVLTLLSENKQNIQNKNLDLHGVFAKKDMFVMPRSDSFPKNKP